jgi:hypothetical protein
VPDAPAVVLDFALQPLVTTTSDPASPAAFWPVPKDRVHNEMQLQTLLECVRPENGGGPANPQPQLLILVTNA